MLGSITLAGLLFTAFATTPAHDPEPLTSRAAPAPQDGTKDEIEKLRADLHLPGPEARLKREGAVSVLLGMKALEAHRVLQDVMQAEKDADEVIPTILSQLLPRLQNERDPVFGDGAKAAVVQVRASYLRPLILLAGGRHQRPPAVAESALDALRCDAYKSWDRVPAFRALLAEGDRLDRLAAVRAAGRCRDLSLARELGPCLEDGDPEVQDAVVAALRRLTFRQAAFADKADLDAWLEKLGAKSFVDLANERAVDSERELAEARARSREGMVALTLELIEAYVRQPEIQWRKIQGRVLGDGAFTAECLGRLRSLLAAAEILTGSAPDRLALFEQLYQRLSAEPPPAADERAMLLEVCAYLAAPGEPPAESVVQFLVEGLRSPHPGIRLAAVSGLRRHPSESNRGHVVEVARDALVRDDEDLLRAALATLHAKDWQAPLPDGEAAHGRAEWAALLKDTLRLPDLSFALREEALRVLDLRDQNQARVAEGFDILFNVVTQPEQDARFRERALIQLQDYATDAASVERYVQLLDQCLADGAKEIRSSAAERVHQVPAVGEKVQIEAWTERLVQTARARLLVEPEHDVHKRLADSIRLAAEKQIGEKVDPKDRKRNLSEHLRLAAVELAAAPAEVNVAFRRKNLSDALGILASRQDVPLDFWVQSAEALLELGERGAVRSVLGRHEQIQTLQKPDADAKWVERARKLTINTALRRSSEKPWKDPAHLAEAQAVLSAVAGLQKGEALPHDPAITLLRMDIHGDLGEDQQVVDLAATLPADQSALGEAARQRVALRAARSHLALGQPVQAYEWVMRLSRNGTVAAAVLDGLEEIGRALLDGQEYGPACAAGEVLVRHTPPASPRYGARLLLHADALLAADPGKNRDTVRTTLETHRAVFENEGVPPELRQRYEELLARATNGSNG